MKKPPKPLMDKKGEVRPLEKADVVTFSMLRDDFPELALESVKRKVGRPKKANAKKLQSFKLSPDVIADIKASGAGFNARVEAVLRQALSEGRL